VTLSVVLEELGRALAPTPFLMSALVAPGTIARFGTGAQQREWLPSLASGEWRVALAHLGSEARWDASGCGLEGSVLGDRLVLSGSCPFVQDGLTATHLLVSCRLTAGPGLGLALVHAEQPGIERRAIELNEKTRGWAEIHLRDVTVRSAALVGGVDGGVDAFAYALDLARTGLAAELAGGARRVLDLSVEYAKTREQFGQPIGQFQAIAHKCSNMLLAVENMSSAALYAAWSVGAGEDDARTAACLAKSLCSDAYTQVASDGIQVHGGLGFTWEQDLHLYFKHAKAAEFLYGSSHELRELAARDLIDGA
jgi:alkylation response protein AidB-like acyl-CoA dehydrogenase